MLEGYRAKLAGADTRQDEALRLGRAADLTPSPPCPSFHLAMRLGRGAPGKDPDLGFIPQLINQDCLGDEARRPPSVSYGQGLTRLSYLSSAFRQGDRILWNATKERDTPPGTDYCNSINLAGGCAFLPRGPLPRVSPAGS